MDVLAGLRYEEAIDDWLNIFSRPIEAGSSSQKQVERRLAHNDQQKDPVEGVTTLRMRFLVCFASSASSITEDTINSEFLRFISKFEMLFRRLKAAWTDLMPEVAAESPQFLQQNRHAAQAQQLLGLPPRNDPDTLRTCVERMTQRHISIQSQLFIIRSELADHQHDGR